ncbi:RNA-binding protein 28 [Malaya genurostris]|uniref:RNA-binding protein 28 n=1 Tax=Malaya genurostris TaxID=325434 RepID=UPI0026F3EE1A|nr:RNA-binding protein 28 [Malaya genurostris]XP_058458795.1 RNA-binding protein 28 [Malaya genurostris]
MSTDKSEPEQISKNKYISPSCDADCNDVRALSRNAARKRSREFARRQCRIIIRNVPYKLTQKKLRDEFEQYGVLKDINILKRTDGKLVGCVFLQYEHPDQSERAIKMLNGKMVMGRKLEACYALPKDTYTKMKSKQDIKHEGNKYENSIGEVNKGEKDDFEIEESDKDIMDEDSFAEDIKPPKPLQQKKLEEIEEGRTVFLKNVPYDANETILKDTMCQFGTVDKVFINRERVSGHSKGTAFVIFKLKDSAEICKKQSLKILVNNQFIEIVDALKRKDIRDKENQANERPGKDSRNLYLLKEGLIMAGSPAAKNVSKTDMAQRLRLEQRCAQMLKNLNRFVSRERLTIHNLSENCTSADLRKIVHQHTGCIPIECRVMRENTPSFGNPSGKSRGYGFLSFKNHNISLEVLRKLNNNPKVFGKNSRPIVAFSIEDRKVHNIKQQRLLKSRLNNPTYQEKLKKIQEKKFLRRKERTKAITEKIAIVPNVAISNLKNCTKTPKKERKRKLENMEEFTGEISRQGRIGIRSSRKINAQAEAHMQRIKSEKQQARKKRVKKEHEKNRQLKAKRRVKQKHTNLTDLKQEDQYFQQTVGRYKQIIHDAVKNSERSRWYSG